MKVKSRIGLVVAVLALVTMACTCGGFSGLGQAQGQIQTAEAAATQVDGSSLAETAEALATSVSDNGGVSVDLGNVPENIPVMESAENVVSVAGTVSYTIKADYQAVVDFYKQGMLDKGWIEAQAPVEIVGSLGTLTYSNDTQQAVVAITSQGGESQVAITITPK